MDLLTIFELMTVIITGLVCLYFLWKPFSEKLTPLQEGIEFLRNHEYEKAVSKFSKSIAKNPYDIYSYEGRVKAYLNLGEIKLALEDAQTMLKQQPDNPFAYVTRSLVYNKQGNYEAQLSDLSTAINLQATHTLAYSLRVDTYRQLQQYDNAIADATHLIEELKEQTFLQYLRRGLLYLQTHEYEKSISDLTEAYSRSIGQKQRYNVLMNRVKAFMDSNQLENAVSDADELIYIHPKKPLGYLIRGQLRQVLNQDDKALEDFEKAIGLGSNSESIYLLVGNLYLKSEQHVKAIDSCSQYLASNPDSALAYNNRAWYKAYAGQYEEALVDAEKAISLTDTQAYFWGTRGQAKWLLGDYDGALADFTRADELREEGQIHQVEIAIALAKLGKQTEAIMTWKQATSDESSYQSAEAYQDQYKFAAPFYEAMQELEQLARQSGE